MKGEQKMKLVQRMILLLLVFITLFSFCSCEGIYIAPGGAIVKPQDIALSNQVEVVQAYGVDLDKLWG